MSDRMVAHVLLLLDYHRGRDRMVLQLRMIT